MKLEALAFLLPLALYVSPLFYSYDGNLPKGADHPSMVTRAECEAALSDPSLVIQVGPSEATVPIDLSICETLGEQLVAVALPADREPG